MSTTFLELGVPAALAASLADRGIAEPFPIQVATLPGALAGRDIAGRAPTGSGKTLAFGIPLVLRAGKARPGRPTALVLVPTRELAGQVKDELAKLAGRDGPSVAAFYGGAGFGPQLDALRRGCDIAVACPGRLADLIERRKIRLDEVQTVVVDEADRMADMGFLPEVRRLLDQVRPDRQTLLFSATLDGAVDVLVTRYQRNAERHELEAEFDAPENRQLFWQVERDDRVALTARVVEAEWPAVVFTRTKRGADRLVRQLGGAGVSAEAMHGDRSQSQRERALRAFSTGRVQVLVATDVAARGIHVDGVACVVHYDPPADEKDYVHRSGRTGRAGAAGTVISLVAHEQAREVRRMQVKLGLPTGLDKPDMGTLSTEVRTRPAPMPAPAPRPTASGGGKPRPAAARPYAGGRTEGRPSRPAAARRFEGRTDDRRTEGRPVRDSDGRRSEPRQGERRTDGRSNGRYDDRSGTRTGRPAEHRGGEARPVRAGDGRPSTGRRPAQAPGAPRPSRRKGRAA